MVVFQLSCGGEPTKQPSSYINTNTVVGCAVGGYVVTVYPILNADSVRLVSSSAMANEPEYIREKARLADLDRSACVWE